MLTLTAENFLIFLYIAEIYKYYHINQVDLCIQKQVSYW